MLTESQKDVSARFGSKEPDKFAGIDWSASPLGSPVIDGSLAYIDCTVASVHDGGDHFVVFGAVQSLSEVPKIKPRPLLFYRGDYTGIKPTRPHPRNGVTTWKRFSQRPPGHLAVVDESSMIEFDPPGRSVSCTGLLKGVIDGNRTTSFGGCSCDRRRGEPTLVRNVLWTSGR